MIGALLTKRENHFRGTKTGTCWLHRFLCAAPRVHFEKMSLSVRPILPRHKAAVDCKLRVVLNFKNTTSDGGVLDCAWLTPAFGDLNEYTTQPSAIFFFETKCPGENL